MIDEDTNSINEENFEEMLENSLSRTDNFQTGDRVSGTIIQIDNDSAFVDISGKSEAVIELNEFFDKNNEIKIKVGDEITAYIVSTEKGQIQMSKEIGSGFINLDLIKVAYNNSIPVKGTPVSMNKGGYEVNISDIKCFCPLSQIDLRSPNNPQVFLGKPSLFKIVRIENNGKNIVLSRRALLEEVRANLVSNLKLTLNTDDIIKGTVSSVQNFGIFVDIGGVEGLVPKSELSWSKSSKTDRYKAGEETSVKVISIDWDSNKITLSIKQLSPEPWSNIENYSPGQTYNGNITNLIQSGAFVELEPGLEGFIHISRMSLIKKIQKPDEVVKPGDMVNVLIQKIDHEKKQISLELKTNEPDPWQLPVDEISGKIHIGIIESSKSAGVTVRLENGMVGFIPVGELLMSRNVDVQKAYSTGKEITVSVKDIEKDKKKLILSEKRAEKKKDEIEYNEYINKNEQLNTSTLGEQFKQQFTKIQKNIK